MTEESDHEGRRLPRCTWEGKLRVINKLGEGAHGEVLQVQDTDFRNFARFVAKTVPFDSNAADLLGHEFEIYKQLECIRRKVKGFPQVFMYGVDPSHDKYVLVMSRLGASLREVMKMNGGTIPYYAVLRIGCQILRRLEYMHSKRIVHGDIKPRNLLCGWETFENIYMVDFGLSRFYKDKRTGTHLPITTCNSFQGTEDFASRHAHKRYSVSRRDDLESLGFTLIFMMKGKLPWSRESDDNEALKPGPPLNVSEIKESTSLEDLCSALPRGMEQYMRYVYEMDYYEEPDYEFLINVLQLGMKKLQETGNADNGDELDIWPDASEKITFMNRRNADEIWERIFAEAERHQDEVVPDEIDAIDQGQDQQQPQVKNQNHTMGTEDTSLSPVICQSPEVQGPPVRSNVLKLMRTFISSNRLISLNNFDELSKTSIAQREPAILREGAARRSLLRRFVSMFRSSSNDLDEIRLYYEEDGFRDLSGDTEWY